MPSCSRDDRGAKTQLSKLLTLRRPLLAVLGPSSVAALALKDPNGKAPTWVHHLMGKPRLSTALAAALFAGP